MKKILPFLMLCLLCSCEVEEVNSKQELTPTESEFFTQSYNITGEEYEKKSCETMFRALDLCYSTALYKVTNTDGRVVYYSGPEYGGDKLADQFYNDLQQLAYSPSVKTRGYWSIGKSTVDWYKALKNVDQLYRCAIVGCVTENLNKTQMTDLYNTLMKNKTSIFRDWMGLKYVSAKFEEEYFSTPGRFWYHFANGDLDNYAKKIYSTILNPTTLGDCFQKTDPIHEVAFQLAANDLTPNRLMLSAAGPLIEAGFNTVFASDDLYGSAKLGYDILNDNTKLIIDLKAGTLNTKTLMTAVNTNLGLLTTCIDKVISFDDLTGIKDTQDLGSLITSYCVENGLDVKNTIKELNKAISETLTDMGSWNLSVNSIMYESFEKTIKDILGINDSASDLIFGTYFAGDSWDEDHIILSKDGTFKIYCIDYDGGHIGKGSHSEVELWGEYKITKNKIQMKVTRGEADLGRIPFDNNNSSLNKYYEGTIECYEDRIVLTWKWVYQDEYNLRYTCNFQNKTFNLKYKHND